MSHPSAAGYDRYFALVDLGAGLFLIWAAARMLIGTEPWVTLIETGWLLILLAAFWRGRRDEFADHCWRRATSATFAMLIVAPIAVSFSIGVADGFMDRAPRESFEPPLDAILLILFATFFATFEWVRFKGGRG